MRTRCVYEPGSRVLEVVFDRLYTLRNQPIHGGVTWNSRQTSGSAGCIPGGQLSRSSSSAVPLGSASFTLTTEFVFSALKKLELPDGMFPAS